MKEDIYFLIVTGAGKRDQKWFFRNRGEVNKFIDEFNIDHAELTHFVKEDGRDVHRAEKEILKGEKARMYWDEHMVLLRVDPALCPLHMKIFKGTFFFQVEEGKHKSLITNDDWVHRLGNVCNA